MTAEEVFLAHSASKLRQLAERIGACLDQLTPEQVWLRHADHENAAGNLVLHLCGNVRQWIGFGVAGLPDVRRRDSEFAAAGGLTSTELKQQLLQQTEEAAEIIAGLPQAALVDYTHIQGYELTKLEAIYHVVEHFSHHTGQIIFITKWCTGRDTGFYRHLNQAAHTEQVP